MKKYFLPIVMIFFCACCAFAGMQLTDFLTDRKDNLWILTPVQSRKVLNVIVRPQNRSADIMRYHSTESDKYVRFDGRIVPEIIFYFKNKQLTSVVISIYNRGDSKAISENDFTKLSARAEQFISELTQDQEPLKETRKFDKFRVDSTTWKSSSCDYVLRRNRKGKYPEYLQLMIYPAGKSKKLRDALKTQVKKDQLQLNLNIMPNGDNYLDIPMVNQGRKGYCVGATVERVMKYYGSQIDQQLIAQLAESDAYNGTNINKIVSVLHKNKSKLRINVDKEYEDDIFSYEEIRGLTERYNNFARRKKRSRIDFKDYIAGRRRSRRVDYVNLIRNYEYDLFRDARCKNERDVQKFVSIIQQSLNSGIPVAWCTFVFPHMQTGRKIGNFGFHMRIINGINLKTNKIIYTDSWGNGHEKKYMNITDAKAITLMILQITPR